MSKINGSVISLFAFMITFTAVFWSSGAPLWFDWRVYPEQILLVALAFALAVAFLTRPGSLHSLSIILAILSLLFGSWLAIRFPVLSENQSVSLKLEQLLKFFLVHITRITQLKFQILSPL